MAITQVPPMDPEKRSFFKAAGAVAAVAGAKLLSGQKASAQAAAITDADILNFALNLEYLEAEFYAYATTGSGIDASLFTGGGTQGATTGGAAVPFDGTSSAKSVAAGIAADELNHVKFLRSALGSAAVAKPAIKLDALAAMSSQAAFLELARAFEDTGVSAYAGAAPLLESKAYLQAAAQIMATEALHTGNVRKLAVQLGAPNYTLDSLDIPPSPQQYFSVDGTTGLVAVRTTTQVLAIVYGGNATTPGGFFPNGLNGTIR